MCDIFPNKNFFCSLFVFFQTGSSYVAQIGLELIDSSALASQVLGLQVCTTTPSLEVFFYGNCYFK
jgi:hypothetical protein